MLDTHRGQKAHFGGGTSATCTGPRQAIVTFAALAAAFLMTSCARQSPTPLPLRTIDSLLVAPHAPLPSGFQRGVNFAHIHRRGHGYGSQQAALELDTLKEIGVNWIAITPFGYQESDTADEVRGYPGGAEGSEFFRHTDPTLTDDDLKAQIDSAHVRGIRVTLKPQLWSRDFWNGEKWNGTVHQSSAAAHQRWWKSYREFALHYARLAAEDGADQYCVGTELAMITTRYPVEWRDLIGDIRRIYHGSLTYAAHWETEFEHIEFWDALDFIGITAYFPLDAPENATVDELLNAWKPIRDTIQMLSDRVRRPVLFLEAGYPAASASYQKPWVYRNREVDESAQAVAYDALFRAFSKASWWKGIYIWKDFTDPARTYERRDRTGFSFRHRAAELVLRNWFSSGTIPPPGDQMDLLALTHPCPGSTLASQSGGRAD